MNLHELSVMRCEWLRCGSCEHASGDYAGTASQINVAN
jgi:hypothetical protein